MRAISVSCLSFRSSALRLTLIAAFVVAGMLGAPVQGQEAAAGPRPLITQTVDESQLTTLTGNTHPLARPENDLGTAPASLPMARMLLVLKRGNDQEAALRKLLDDQQDKASPNYHQWLTPEQYGQQFGPTDTDLQTITAWLQSHGFEVGSTKGRTVLEFSGTAGQVQEAFHTTIHKYIVKGEQHWANASDPSIPTALTPAVAGIDSLHNFRKKAMNAYVGKYSEKTKSTDRQKPDYSRPVTRLRAAAGRLATRSLPTILRPSTTCCRCGSSRPSTAPGRRSRSSARTNINPYDPTDFLVDCSVSRSPQTSSTSSSTVLIREFNSDEGEADIDIQWSGRSGATGHHRFRDLGSRLRRRMAWTSLRSISWTTIWLPL